MYIAMKKLMVFGISSVLLFLFLLPDFVFAVRINEVELNPEGTDAGNEWVELYSEQEVNLSGWKLVNGDNKSVSLDSFFQGYVIINFSGQWLDNSEESLGLFNGDALIDSVQARNDTVNDARTWQYCNGTWLFRASTKGAENSCAAQAPAQNQSQNTAKPTPQNQSEPKISLKLDWDEEDIINGEDFEIEIKASNLKSGEYDVKIYITPEKDNEVISDIYDEEDGKWKSGTYYSGESLSGPGIKSEAISVRIKDKYKNFSGDAKIIAKIRKFGVSSIVAQVEKDIEVLEKEEKEESAEEKKDTENSVVNAAETEFVEQAKEVIRLGGGKKPLEQKIENAKAPVIYESASEKIKKYSVYALNLVLIFIIISLLISFKKREI